MKCIGIKYFIYGSRDGPHTMRTVREDRLVRRPYSVLSAPILEVSVFLSLQCRHLSTHVPLGGH